VGVIENDANLVYLLAITAISTIAIIAPPTRKTAFFENHDAGKRNRIE
jgi:hypothetical protein